MATVVSRRWFARGSAALAAIFLLNSISVARADPPWKVADRANAVARPFPLEDVELLGGPFKESMDLNRKVLLALKPDRLLAPVRREAGLELKAPVYGGWEAAGVASHTLGHYLSAIAMQYAATGDEECKKRAAYMVAEMAECQKANGSGYAAGVPKGEQTFAEVAAGDIRSAGFDLNGLWVPWYTIHKVLAGLRDVYLLTGNEQAKQVLVDFSEYCWEVVDDLNDEQMQKLLACEHGGMNEVAADVYALTGDPRFLEMARKFYHKSVLDPLTREEDQLPGLHANTQVPKIIGCARLYELTGEKRWRTAAEFFFDRVANHYSYANGGNSYNEHFGKPDTLDGTLHDTTEACNSYNMLKLAGHLFCYEPRAELMEYHERVMLNHILAHQHPKTGMYVYKGFLDPATRKEFSTLDDSFWCCVGTGLENHTKYTENAYFRSEDALWVNLFLPSRLEWEEMGIAVVQSTGFPNDGNVALRIETEKPAKFTMHVRIPAWLDEDVAVSVSGEDAPMIGKAGSYLAIEREWKNGDVVSFVMPMKLRLESMPDDESQVAFFHGPILLCAVNEERDVPPTLVGTEEELLKLLKARAGKTASYETDAAGDWGKVVLVPHHRVADERYSVYLRRLSRDQWEKRLVELKEEQEQQRKLDAATTDFFQPGEMQPERDHSFTGERTHSGRNLDRAWRDARDGGWMRFDMAVDPALPMDLVCTWFGGDAGARRFDILVEGKVAATVDLKGGSPDRFVDVPYPIDAAITKGQKKVSVELRARPGNIAGPLFGVRMVRRSD